MHHFVFDNPDCSVSTQAEAYAYVTETIRSQVFLAELGRNEGLALKIWGDRDLGLEEIKEQIRISEGDISYQEMFAIVDIPPGIDPQVIVDDTLDECRVAMRATLIAARGLDYRHIKGLPRYSNEQGYLLLLFGAFRPLSPEADVRWVMRKNPPLAVFTSARPGMAEEILGAIDYMSRNRRAA